MMLRERLISMPLSRGYAGAIQPLTYLLSSAESASLWVQPPSGSSRRRMDRYIRWHWQGQRGVVKPKKRMRRLGGNFYRERRITRTMDLERHGDGEPLRNTVQTCNS